MIKIVKHIKLVIYILCMSSLFLPVNLNGHGDWIFGFNYIISLFSDWGDGEMLFWFFFYFMLFILPVVGEFIVWKYSKRGVFSDIADIVIGTGVSTLLFCYFVSYSHKPAGVLVVVVLQIILIAIGCVDLLLKIFSQEYFDELILKKMINKKQK